MFEIRFILFVIQSICLIGQINGHGFLADPPARSSAWLYDPDFAKCCTYYNHIQMFCGGADREWRINKGKCSICGEAYDSQTKLFGMGDAMYLGKIVRTYTQGAIIPVTVDLTANHLGSFEFRVCSIDADPNQDATQACLDLNLLKTANGLTKFPVEKSYKSVTINVTLPSDLVCKHCVFQWKYKTGNSWGTWDGQGCLGCGKANEEFYGCSDIAIVSSNESIVTETSTNQNNIAITTNEVTIESTTSPQKCTSAITFSQAFDLSNIMDQYCQIICPNCPLDVIGDNDIVYKGCINSCKILCTCG